MNSNLQAVYDYAVSHEHEHMNDPHNAVARLAGAGLALFWLAMFVIAVA